MAVHRVSFLAFLLLFGTSLLVSNVEHADAKACPFNCDPRIAYGVCPRSEEKKNNQICTNCCAGTKGCNYFSADGTFVCKGESDPRNPKACPRNCDPRIDYRVCPRSEEKDNQMCTNCCAGTKGCNYFSADGTFVCKGESDPRNPKACPRNCDPRIDYRVCPRSEEKDNQICTNCCAGTKGCNYFSVDGTFVCKGESDPRNPKACPRNCDPRIDYRVCPRSEEKDNQICTNCCAGTKGCNYFSANGTFVCKGESDPRNPKACPRNCDPRIDYRVCPRSEEKDNQICTNCCAGTKGCNYFSADGTFVCKGESDPRNPKGCPRNCDPRIDYRVCPRSEEKNNQICTNCCAGTKGCNYFSADGTFVCKGESDPRNPKACPRNCDPRIDYRVCWHSEEKNNQICTNCCAGTKGCNYFSANGTFICEGESEYVSKVDE
uniref:Trypsin proteinase inhibitor n=1 Tax=Nicotiana acuminata TaxID=4086 RepID=Q1WL38_NICAC|nr:trypsin proteinase inhibitor precursor [Nicotiana acuminata]